MIVNYTGNRVLSVPVPKRNPGEIKFSVPVGGAKLVRVLPGYNEIPEEDWKVVADSLQLYIDNGKMETFGRKEKVEIEVEIPEDERTEDGEETRRVVGTEEVGVPLKKLIPRLAREAVDNCFNLESLNLWLNGSRNYEAETRDEIRNAIKDQLEKVKTGNQPEAVGVVSS